MTGLLASVRSVEEAMIAMQGKVDIIDLKEPDQGALGAVPISVMSEIVSMINGEHVISATVGDLPCDPQRVSSRIRNVAETGVDLIKVGLFEPFNALNQELLQQISQQSSKGIIIVLFADHYPGHDMIDQVADAGLAGVMLDTADKTSGSLRKIMEKEQIKQFICHAKRRNLITGLAGSLSKTDISPLMKLQPDYLGFRGAICQGHERKTDLDIGSLNEIRSLIQTEEERYGAVA